jgi:hypothetical protein
MTVDYHHRGGKTERQIRTVEFTGDAVLITYSTIPDDIREKGLILTHTLVIPLDDTVDYEEEFVSAYEALQTLLSDALEDVENLPPYDPREEEDDDDEDELDDPAN